MKKFSFKVEKKDSDLVIIINDIVKARYKLSISSQKLLLYLISHITYEERKEGKFLNELKFNLKEILLFYKSAGVNSFKDLKEKYLTEAKNLKCTINDRLANTIKSNANTEIGKIIPNNTFLNPVNTKVKSLHDVKADKKIIIFNN